MYISLVQANPVNSEGEELLSYALLANEIRPVNTQTF